MVVVIKRSDAPLDKKYEEGLDISFGINKYTVGSNNIVMGYTVVPPKGRNKRHYHANCDAAMFIIKGRLKFFIGKEGKEYIVGPESFVFVPKNEIHGLQNLSDTEEAALIFAYAGVGSKEEAGTIFIE